MIFHRETNEKTHPGKNVVVVMKITTQSMEQFFRETPDEITGFSRWNATSYTIRCHHGRGNPRTQWSFIAKSIVTSDLYPTFRAKTHVWRPEATMIISYLLVGKTQCTGLSLIGLSWLIAKTSSNSIIPIGSCAILGFPWSSVGCHSDCCLMTPAIRLHQNLRQNLQEILPLTVAHSSAPR